MNLVTASMIVLWIVVITLVVVVLALARQVGVLYERVACWRAHGESAT